MSVQRLLRYGAVLELRLDDLAVPLALVDECLLQPVGLVEVMEVLDGLLQADSDDQAADYGGDVDEELFPGAGSVVGRVDVEKVSSGKIGSSSGMA